MRPSLGLPPGTADVACSDCCHLKVIAGPFPGQVGGAGLSQKQCYFLLMKGPAVPGSSFSAAPRGWAGDAAAHGSSCRGSGFCEPAEGEAEGSGQPQQQPCLLGSLAPC